MNRIVLVEALLSIASLALLTNCGAKVQADPKAEAPPPVPVEQVADVNLVKVQHPEQFPIATAGSFSAAPELSVTGAVNPDVSRQVPVISLASGRIVQVLTRLGDTVTKGQLLMEVQSADRRLNTSVPRFCMTRERLPKRTWKWLRTRRTKLSSRSKPRLNI
jgi:cobalt-zinc-cadmium efflux system membrane fusion protein